MGRVAWRPLLVTLLLVRLAALLISIGVAHTRPVKDPDIIRFDEIATSEGRPYRDFQVEYAPIELTLIRAVGGDNASSTASSVAVVWLVCELATAAAIWYGWGERATTAYLLIGLPLVPLMVLRLDPVVIALTSIAFALIRRGKERMGGAILAVSVLTKLWPLVLVPSLLVGRKRGALKWFGGVLTVGTIAWIAYGGFGSIAQVMSFRQASGWHAESTIGAIVWIVTGGPIRFEQGTRRVGLIPGWARGALLTTLLAGLAGVWTRARRWAGDPSGAPSLAAVALLIGLSPLFSLQYAAWLLPWAAILAAENRGRMLPRFVVGVVALTALLHVLFVLRAFHGWALTLIQVVLVARNALCLGIVAAWFVVTRSLRSGAKSTQG